MIKLVSSVSPKKDKVILYNTFTIFSNGEKIDLLVWSQIDITKIDPKKQQHVFDLINKIYNKHITVDESTIKQNKKSWWNIF